jgi:stage III sporulation protein AF
MNFIKTWISDLAVLVILLALLDLLIPEGGVKKLVNLISGLVLVLALITPPVRFICGQGREQFMGFVENIDFIGKSFRSQLDYSDNRLSDSILYEYRSNLENAISDIVMRSGDYKQVKCDVVLDSDGDSEAYGEILRIVLDIKVAKSGDVENANYWIAGSGNANGMEAAKRNGMAVNISGDEEVAGMTDGMIADGIMADGIRSILAEKLGVNIEIISIRFI